MKISEYAAWNYVAADSTTQIGGYIKKFDRLTWLTVKDQVATAFRTSNISDRHLTHR